MAKYADAAQSVADALVENGLIDLGPISEGASPLFAIRNALALIELDLREAIQDRAQELADLEAGLGVAR